MGAYTPDDKTGDSSHSAAGSSLSAALGIVIRILDVTGAPLTFSLMIEFIHQADRQHRISVPALRWIQVNKAECPLPIAAPELQSIGRREYTGLSEQALDLRLNAFRPANANCHQSQALSPVLRFREVTPYWFCASRVRNSVRNKEFENEAAVV